MFKTPFLAIAALILAACAANTPQRAPLALTLHNIDGVESLRCVIILAHFVSVDIGVIEPGETQDIDFTRVVDTGSLIVNAADGREMEVENLLCGSDSQWTQTRGDVPLLPLCATTQRRLTAACGSRPRLHCDVASP